MRKFSKYLIIVCALLLTLCVFVGCAYNLGNNVNGNNTNASDVINPYDDYDEPIIDDRPGQEEDDPIIDDRPGQEEDDPIIEPEPTPEPDANKGCNGVVATSSVIVLLAVAAIAIALVAKKKKSC